ncbi:MAG: HNH endonuclease signature motif containing protein, partial [Mycobacterium sp.]
CDSEDRYRPSTALAEFVRTRDLTCRWPGCDRPAAHADIDHTKPWPAGPTHPGNIKCYCRLHHLVKTFWDGFTDAQFPDGTVQVTTPTGHTYTTKPYSTLLFPAWNITTPPAPDTSERPSEPKPGRGLMMPTRRRTREQSRAARIATERRLNAIQRDLDIAAAAAQQAQRAARRAQKQTQTPPTPIPSYEFPPAGYEPDYGDDPPPF